MATSHGGRTYAAPYTRTSTVARFMATLDRSFYFRTAGAATLVLLCTALLLPLPKSCIGVSAKLASGSKTTRPYLATRPIA